jgi:hypothetical protein
VVVIIVGKVRSEDHPHHQVLPLVVTIHQKQIFLSCSAWVKKEGPRLLPLFYSSHAWN